MKTKNFAVLMISMMAFAVNVRGAVIASYPFSAGSTDSVDTDTNSIATAISSSKSYIGLSSGNSNYFILAFSGTSSVYSADFTEAVSNSRYFAFTIFAVPGQILNLNTLRYNYGGSAGSLANFDAQVQVRSSADNYASPLGTSSNVFIPSNSSATNTAGYHEIDLSAFPALQGSTSITFRIYAAFLNPVNFATNQNLSVRVDNLEVEGSVQVTDVLAQYPFVAGSSNSVDFHVTSSASSWSDIKDYIGISSSASNAFIRAYNNASNSVFSTDFESAVTNGRYVEFSVAANPALVLDLKTLNFRYGGAASATSSYTAVFQVRSSADNYAAPLGTTPGLPVPNSAPATNTPALYTLDLSAFPILQGGTAITFRIYGIFQNPSGFSYSQSISLRLDDIILRGATMEPGSPEPAPDVVITGFSASPATFKLVSTGTNTWMAVPQYTTNLLANPQVWSDLVGYTNSYADGTNTITGPLPEISAPVLLRIVNTQP